MEKMDVTPETSTPPKRKPNRSRDRREERGQGQGQETRDKDRWRMVVVKPMRLHPYSVW
jgi:hypothetical protein